MATHFSNFSVLFRKMVLMKMLRVMKQTQRKDTQSACVCCGGGGGGGGGGRRGMYCDLYYMLLSNRMVHAIENLGGLTKIKYPDSLKNTESNQFIFSCPVGYVVVSLRVCMHTG